MSTDIKLSEAQLPKIIKSGGFLGKALSRVIHNLGKKVLIDLAVTLAKDVLPVLTIKATYRLY